MTDPQPLNDLVPRDGVAVAEIGFACPDRYNASALLFDNLEKGRGDRAAVFSPLGTWSYAELCARACRWGHGLAGLGLGRGERVLFLLHDSPDCAAAFFGALRAGLVPVLINTLSPPELIGFYLQDAGARVALIDAGLAPTLLTADATDGAPLDSVVLVNGAADPVPGVARTLTADALLAERPETLAPADTHRDDMAFWMYSSGSTGRPKGIVHLHHDMAYTAASYSDHILRLTPDDICFSGPKIFFAYGLGNSLTFPFAAGAASVLLPGRPEPQAIFETIARFRPTVFFGLPTLYTALIHAPGAREADLSSLRLCISAAEILSAEVFNGWKALSGHEIVEGLGSTEVLHIYLSNTPTAKRLGAAGKRVPGYELRLTDLDGHDVAPGAEGILWVRGDSAAPAYWNRPDKTAETMRQGWIWTGDRFQVDADGFHFFRGRADDLIKVSGQWVYPLEVELCLADHPAVTECAVLGVELPDRRMTLRAFVVPRDPAADREALTRALQDHAKRQLLPYKYPRQVVFLDGLPKTGTGKIDRQTLARQG